jgi:hypothetical protein
MLIAAEAENFVRFLRGFCRLFQFWNDLPGHGPRESLYRAITRSASELAVGREVLPEAATAYTLHTRRKADLAGHHKVIRSRTPNSLHPRPVFPKIVPYLEVSACARPGTGHRGPLPLLFCMASQSFAKISVSLKKKNNLRH